MKPTVAVIGGGPAGLACAEVLAMGGCKVTVIEQMPSVGRKLLMAGRSGLNLTHAEPRSAFLARYGAAEPFLRPMIEAFDADALRGWAEGLGEACFVGTSGRVFPKSMKASPLLRAWMVRLASLGVSVRTRTRWTGFTPDGVTLDGPDGAWTLPAQATVLATGGASWSRLGSDGRWIDRLPGVNVRPFTPANCGFTVAWSPLMSERFEGQPLKSIALHHADRVSRGDAVITRAGLEGGAVYALSAPIRDAIARDGSARISIDLRPDLDASDIAERLSRVRARETLSNRLRKALRLAPCAVGLLREGGPVPEGTAALAARIKAVPLTLRAPDSLDRAISVGGGIALDELDAGLMVRALPGVFAAGEMLDWEAPTGGYLLQACFATGRAAGHGALTWLREGGSPLYPSAP